VTHRLPLAIIANEPTPYRVNFHRRIALEMPDVELWSLFTDQVSSSPWQYRADPTIETVWFGTRECHQTNALRASFSKWLQGGAITHWLESHAIRAIVLYGYNDAARFRVLRWAWARRIPCFLFGDGNVRCDMARGLRALVKRRYVPWVLRRTSGVFYCGSLGRSYFLRYGAKEDQMYSVPYEPDYALFAGAGPAHRANACERYGLSGSRRYLLFAGRMIASKRPDLLVSAFESIAGARPDWDLVMVGDGPLLGPLRSIDRGLLNGRIHWLGFIAEPAELANLFAACDVFVLPSEFEPWGVVITEAAHRLALIASSVVGAGADLIEDGVNGRIFASGSAEALRRALLEVTDSANTSRMKAASPGILARWRESSDPVRSLRRALESVKLLPPPDSRVNGR
jgi:glycosyltransferase involved in cell wall biosynthesis